MKKFLSLLTSAIMVVVFTLSTCPTVHAEQTQLDKIINFAKGKLGQEYCIGYCQAFVFNCYKAGGIDNGSASSAIKAWEKWGVSTRKDNIPIGACVYFDERIGEYGHVGLYIGNNKMIHASASNNAVIESSLTWYFNNCYAGWGWQGGVVPEGVDLDLTIRYNANGASINSDTYGINSDGLLKTLSDNSVNIQVNNYGDYQKWGLYDFDTFGIYKKGHDFEGWTINNGDTIYDMSDSWYPEEIYPDLYKGNATITAHAVWNPHKLTIRYNANGGTITSNTYEANNDGFIKKISDNKINIQTEAYGIYETDGFYNNTTFGLYRNGHEFLGWTIDDGATVFDMTASWYPEEIYPDLEKDNATITAYAVWKPTHQYIEQLVAPTCTNQGYTLYTCQECADTYKDNYTPIDPYAHNYIAEITEPTCTQKGYTIYTCSYCGDSYKGDITPIDKDKHTFTEVTTAPTCTTQGYTTYTCTECEIRYTGSYTPIKHNYTETIIPPTEEAEGFTLHICQNCGSGYSDNFVSNKLNVWGVKVTPSDIDVTLFWNAFDGAVEYYAKVYDKDFTKCLKTITTTNTNAVFDSKVLDYNTDYKFIVTAKLSNGKYLTVANAIKADGSMVIGDRVVGLTVKLEGKGAIVDFLPVKNATEYLVNVFERATTGRRIYTQTLDAATTSTRIMTNLDAGSKYVVVINAKVNGSYMPLKDLRVNGIGVSFTAPVYNPTSVTIADQTATSVRFNWDAVRGASQYFIKVTEKESGKVVNTLNVVGKTTATLSRYTDGTKISPDTTYILQFYTYIDSVTNAGEYGAPIEITTIDFEPITVTARHNRNNNKINISWNQTTNAAGYFVYTYKNGVKIANKYLDGADNTIYDVTAPTSSGTYTYGVIAYEKNTSGTAYTPVSISNTINL